MNCVLVSLLLFLLIIPKCNEKEERFVSVDLVKKQHSRSMNYLANSEVISSAFAFPFVWVPNACCTSKSRARSRSHSASLNSRESENPLGGRNFMVSSRLTSLSELIRKKVGKKVRTFATQSSKYWGNFSNKFCAKSKKLIKTHTKKLHNLILSVLSGTWTTCCYFA